MPPFTLLYSSFYVYSQCEELISSENKLANWSVSDQNDKAGQRS